MVPSWLLTALLIPGSYDPAPEGFSFNPVISEAGIPYYAVPGPTFRIPFNIHRLDPDSVEQLRLYVFTDGGRSWAFSASATPDQGGFEFTAKAAGEHCFAVQVKRKTGRLDPSEVALFQPQIVVAVKQGEPEPPAVALDAEAAKLSDDLTRIELDLIRKELKLIAAADRLTPKTMDRIDALKLRLYMVQNQVQMRAALAAVGRWNDPPSPGPGWGYSPMVPGSPSLPPAPLTTPLQPATYVPMPALSLPPVPTVPPAPGVPETPPLPTPIIPAGRWDPATLRLPSPGTHYR